MPGLGLEIGEPAINPVPRKMMVAETEKLLTKYQIQRGIVIEISVPGGKSLPAGRLILNWVLQVGFLLSVLPGWCVLFLPKLLLLLSAKRYRWPKPWDAGIS